MSRMSVFSSPLMLGFDELERMLDHATKTAGDGYPPYNIERIVTANRTEDRTEDGTEDRTGDALRIVLAVAGFSRDELEISLEENQLLISGRQIEDEQENQRDYLHRGIAARQFKRNFVLANGMEVRGADLENGLLSIDLIRPALEHTVRKIEITES